MTCSNSTYGDTYIKQGAEAVFDVKPVEVKEKGDLKQPVSNNGWMFRTCEEQTSGVSRWEYNN